MKDSWKRHFWRNTATNYLNVAVRLGSGLVLFRLLFQHLTHAQFGYYALLWSMFGYAILLDFGLGVTMQKTVAEKAASGDMATLNRLVSTIIWSFAIIGALLFTVFAIARPWFLDWIKVAPADRAEFGTAYLVFFGALGVQFPLGLFPEMIRGLQRLDLVNWGFIGSNMINLALMIWALFAKWPFPIIMLISVGTTVGGEMVSYFLVRRLIPGLSLHPRNFHFPEVRGVLSFSLVAYLITFTNLIMLRTDQVVISVTIGVASVALYQVGYKASDVFGLFSKQMQEALSPAAAHLGARKDQDGLLTLLLGSTRLTILITTPLYALSAAYLEPAIKILSGLKQVDPTTFWVGETLLLATYSSLVTNSCSKRILMMCGWERKLLKLSLLEAGLNLLLSVILVFPLGVLGVALGTLIPTLLVGWFGTIPVTARFAEKSCGALFREFIEPVTLPVAASVLVLASLLISFPLSQRSAIADCIWRGATVLLTLLVFAVPYLRSSSRQIPSPAT